MAARPVAADRTIVGLGERSQGSLDRCRRRPLVRAPRGLPLRRCGVRVSGRLFRARGKLRVNQVICRKRPGCCKRVVPWYPLDIDDPKYNPGREPPRMAGSAPAGDEIVDPEVLGHVVEAVARPGDVHHRLELIAAGLQPGVEGSKRCHSCQTSSAVKRWRIGSIRLT